MTAKKWLITFAATAVLLALLLGLFNVLTDPFGVFGDPLMHWWSYDETNNPRTAKYSYLEQHPGEYDSFIVGSSSTSSFPTAAFEALYGGRFYNMIVYGADMLDSEQTVRYLIDSCGAKRIVLNISLENAVYYGDETNPYTHSMPWQLAGSNPIRLTARFLFANPAYGMAKLAARRTDTWLPQPFDVFDEATGCYDKRTRDVEPIGSMADYLEAYPVFADYPAGNYGIGAAESCVESLRHIVEACREAGVELTVVTAPIYKDCMAYFREEDVKTFWRMVAGVTDFWDFSYSSVSCEPRYFYDSTHFRNAVGEMAAARIAGDTSVWIPDDFGTYVTAENADAYLEHYFDVTPEDYDFPVPVLMYHNLSETEKNGMTVTPDEFREQMTALKNAGFTAITTAELEAFVTTGTALPDMPVLITFDDGYVSVYEYAYPILRETGMKAAVYVIGSSVGTDTYKNNGTDAIHPHFTMEQAAEMVSSGIIELGSHTYDMHQAAQFEADPERARTTMAQLDGEREDDYLAALRADFAAMRDLIGEVTSMAFPEGVHSDVIRAVAKEEGVTVSFGTAEGTAEVVRGLPQSLIGMKRLLVWDGMSGELLLQRIGKAG